MTTATPEPTPRRVWELTQTDPRVLAALEQWRAATGAPAPTRMVLAAGRPG
jgi:hypothetical protein